MQMMEISQKLKSLITKGVEPADTQEEAEDAAPLRERVIIEDHEVYVTQAYSWRLISIVESFALILVVFFVVYMGCQNRFIPYVITIGVDGKSFTVHEAQRASTVDESVVLAHIKQFIIKARSVVSDPVIQNYNINGLVYPMVTGDARQYIDAWYKVDEYQPFMRMSKGTVDVQVNTIVPSGEEYEVTWTETSRNKLGNFLGTEIWEATIGSSFFPLEGEPSRTNPLGFYITTLHWTKKL